MYSFYDLMENGGTNNAGFQALPDYVQNQILANMARGGAAPTKKYKESNFSGNAWYQEGGEEEGAAQQEQIMQIIQMYAQLTEMEPEAVLEELQGMEEEEQQQALQSMVEQIQSAQGQQQEDASEEQGEVSEDDAEEEYMKRGGQPCYSCGGAMKYQTGGYIPEYAEMAYGGAAPQNYSAKQGKKFNFAMGGPAVGQEMEVTPKELENLRKQGYQFQII
jgi:hypothetical protein